MLGNARLTTFPPWEMDFGTLPTASPHRDAQSEVGPQVSSEARHHDGQGAGSERRAARTPEPPREATYRALYMSGFARMDFRLRSDGRVFLLEANANPELEQRRGPRRLGESRRHELYGARQSNRAARARVHARVAHVRALKDARRLAPQQSRQSKSRGSGAHGKTSFHRNGRHGRHAGPASLFASRTVLRPPASPAARVTDSGHSPSAADHPRRTPAADRQGAAVDARGRTEGVAGRGRKLARVFHRRPMVAQRAVDRGRDSRRRRAADRHAGVRRALDSREPRGAAEVRVWNEHQSPFAPIADWSRRAAPAAVRWASKRPRASSRSRACER